jgi:hypothetical protein
MYVAKIPNRHSPPTSLLRESFREDGKVKSRTIGNITSLGVEKIALISQILKGTPILPASVFHINRSRPHGHVAKYIKITIKNGLLSFQRNTKSIQHESELDGIYYVLRTNVPATERAAPDIVRDYKRLADVEKSFRTIKTTLLDVRP